MRAMKWHVTPWIFFGFPGCASWYEHWYPGFVAHDGVTNGMKMPRSRSDMDVGDETAMIVAV